MKTKILVSFSIAVFCAATAPAQNPPPRPPAPAAGGLFFPALNRVLTEAQRESLRAALASQRDQMTPLEEKLRAARRALIYAAASGKFDEGRARQNAAAAAGAEAELAVIYARALSQMRPPLSAPQVRQLDNFPPGRFQPPGGAAAASAPVTHLALPPPLPGDTNDLPVLQ